MSDLMYHVGIYFGHTIASYFSFLVAVIGQTRQHTAIDIAVPIVTMANMSSMNVASN